MTTTGSAGSYSKLPDSGAVQPSGVFSPVKNFFQAKVDTIYHGTKFSLPEGVKRGDLKPEAKIIQGGSHSKNHPTELSFGEATRLAKLIIKNGGQGDVAGLNLQQQKAFLDNYQATIKRLNTNLSAKTTFVTADSATTQTGNASKPPAEAKVSVFAKIFFGIQLKLHGNIEGKVSAKSQELGKSLAFAESRHASRHEVVKEEGDTKITKIQTQQTIAAQIDECRALKDKAQMAYLKLKENADGMSDTEIRAAKREIRKLKVEFEEKQSEIEDNASALKQHTMNKVVPFVQTVQMANLAKADPSNVDARDFFRDNDPKLEALTANVDRGENPDEYNEICEKRFHEWINENAMPLTTAILDALELVRTNQINSAVDLAKAIKEADLPQNAACFALQHICEDMDYFTYSHEERGGSIVERKGYDIELVKMWVCSEVMVPLKDEKTGAPCFNEKGEPVMAPVSFNYICGPEGETGVIDEEPYGLDGHIEFLQNELGALDKDFLAKKFGAKDVDARINSIEARLADIDRCLNARLEKLALKDEKGSPIRENGKLQFPDDAAVKNEVLELREKRAEAKELAKNVIENLVEFKANEAIRLAEQEIVEKARKDNLKLMDALVAKLKEPGANVSQIKNEAVELYAKFEKDPSLQKDLPILRAQLDGIYQAVKNDILLQLEPYVAKAKAGTLPPEARENLNVILKRIDTDLEGAPEAFVNEVKAKVIETKIESSVIGTLVRMFADKKKPAEAKPPPAETTTTASTTAPAPAPESSATTTTAKTKESVPAQQSSAPVTTGKEAKPITGGLDKIELSKIPKMTIDQIVANVDAGLKEIRGDIKNAFNEAEATLTPLNPTEDFEDVAAKLEGKSAWEILKTLANTGAAKTREAAGKILLDSGVQKREKILEKLEAKMEKLNEMKKELGNRRIALDPSSPDYKKKTAELAEKQKEVQTAIDQVRAQINDFKAVANTYYKIELSVDPGVYARRKETVPPFTEAMPKMLDLRNDTNRLVADRNKMIALRDAKPAPVAAKKAYYQKQIDQMNEGIAKNLGEALNIRREMRKKLMGEGIDISRSGMLLEKVDDIIKEIKKEVPVLTGMLTDFIGDLKDIQADV